MNSSKGNNLFPVFLKPENLRFLIVGGGEVGWEKLGFMFRHAPECNVRLVAIEIKQEIRDLAKQYPDKIELIEQPFDTTHIEGINIAIIATADNRLNTSFHKLIKAKGIVTNVADTPSLCDFYLSSVVKKGDLKIAISSNGKSPTITKRIRELLQDTLPEELDDVIDNLAKIRDGLKGDFEHKVQALNEITSVMTKK